MRLRGSRPADDNNNNSRRSTLAQIPGTDDPADLIAFSKASTASVASDSETYFVPENQDPTGVLRPDIASVASSSSSLFGGSLRTVVSVHRGQE